MRTIIEMDPPQHRSFRKVASPWFTPRALFAELARRVESVELAGLPQWIQSSFVVGLKHLPIRYSFR